VNSFVEWKSEKLLNPGHAWLLAFSARDHSTKFGMVANSWLIVCFINNSRNIVSGELIDSSEQGKSIQMATTVFFCQGKSSVGLMMVD
jgi:hypothetical protein